MHAGPCCVCGARNYASSMGGASICPRCDAGLPPLPPTPMMMQAHGCICPPGSEKTCQGPLCPRRPVPNT